MNVLILGEFKRRSLERAGARSSLLLSSSRQVVASLESVLLESSELLSKPPSRSPRESLQSQCFNGVVSSLTSAVPQVAGEIDLHRPLWSLLRSFLSYRTFTGRSVDGSCLVEVVLL